MNFISIDLPFFLLLTTINGINIFYFYNTQMLVIRQISVWFLSAFFLISEIIITVVFHFFSNSIISFISYFVIMILSLFYINQKSKQMNDHPTMSCSSGILRSKYSLTIFYVFQIICGVVSYFIGQMLTVSSPSHYYASGFGLWIIFGCLTTIVLFLSLLIQKKNGSNFLPNTRFLSVLIPFMHSIVFFLIVYYWNRSVVSVFSGTTVLISICYIISNCINLILLSILLNDIPKQELFLKMEATKHQLERNHNYYNSVQEQISEIETLQKNFNAQLHQAYQLVQTEHGNDTQALKLLDELQARIHQTNLYYFCKEPILNTILEEYHKKSQERNLIFHVNILDMKESFFIDKNDLYMLFSFLLSNAFLNAYEAKIAPCVSIFTYKKANFFIIKVIHSIPSSNQIIHEDKAYRKLFKQILKRYNGTLEYEKKTYFSRILIFPFPENQY